ncbi:MAG: hypothetical protein AAGK47_08125, partial [Bacteroidota bacterium]
DTKICSFLSRHNRGKATITSKGVVAKASGLNLMNLSHVSSLIPCCVARVRIRIDGNKRVVGEGVCPLRIKHMSISTSTPVDSSLLSVLIGFLTVAKLFNCNGYKKPAHFNGKF